MSSRPSRISIVRRGGHATLSCAVSWRRSVRRSPIPSSSCATCVPPWRMAKLSSDMFGACRLLRCGVCCTGCAALKLCNPWPQTRWRAQRSANECSSRAAKHVTRVAATAAAGLLLMPVLVASLAFSVEPTRQSSARVLATPMDETAASRVGRRSRSGQNRGGNHAERCLGNCADDDLARRSRDRLGALQQRIADRDHLCSRRRTATLPDSRPATRLAAHGLQEAGGSVVSHVRKRSVAARSGLWRAVAA